MAESDMRPNAENESNVNQPGQVIVPGGSPAVPQPPQPTPIVYSADAQPENDYTYIDQPADAYGEEVVAWTASEFIAHEKNTSWYANVIVAGVGVSSVIYLITRSFMSSGVILFIFVIFAIYGARQPRQLPYRLDPSGLQIGDRHFPYASFRSFAVMPEGAFSSIVLVPLKRFSPLTSIYYAPQDEERITAMLAAHLPYEERKHDPIDKLMQRIRF
jgi:hypothetical protein